MRLQLLNVIALVIALIGAINWGLVGIFDLDLVATLLGAGSVAAKVAYIVVGVAGLWYLISWVSKKA